MRIIYAAVLTFLIVSMLLFVGSFVYMDKEKRRTYHYDISIDDCNVGTVRVDKFQTEDGLIYKSSSKMPFIHGPSESKEKIILNGEGVLKSYSLERLSPKEVESIYMENGKKGVSFLSRFGPRFIYLEDTPVGRKPFIFNEDSPVTYLPIIEDYNYKDGGSQAFEALTLLSARLPPVKRSVTLTSIRDEYIKIGGRKIKTEKLILKIRNYPQGSIWVAKSNKALIKAELPGLRLGISRTFSPVEVKAKGYVVPAKGYSSSDITFKGKTGDISGTVSMPDGEGKYPAAILIWGDGPHGRSYGGLFNSISDILAKNGIAVLRFDKPGIGSSGGSYLSYSVADEMEDIKNAAAYMASRERIDPERVTVIAHAEGSDILLRAFSDNCKIKSMVLLSPDLFSSENGDPLRSKRLVPPETLSGGYSAILNKCAEDTKSKLEATKGNWTFLLGKRCIMTDMKWQAEAPAIKDIIRSVNIPVLIIQGRKEESVYPEYSSFIDQALQDAGNNARVLAYYGYLGRFLGIRVADCIHRTRYDADKEVIESVANWIKRIPTAVSQK